MPRRDKLIRLIVHNDISGRKTQGTFRRWPIVASKPQVPADDSPPTCSTRRTELCGQEGCDPSRWGGDRLNEAASLDGSDFLTDTARIKALCRSSIRLA